MQNGQHVVRCEISAPSKSLQPVTLWNISMREKATQAQTAAISPQPLALSYAAKHGTPAPIKHSLAIPTGRNNYSLTLTSMACVWTSWCLLWAHVCLQFVHAYALRSTITVGITFYYLLLVFSIVTRAGTICFYDTWVPIWFVLRFDSMEYCFFLFFL